MISGSPSPVKSAAPGCTLQGPKSGSPSTWRREGELSSGWLAVPRFGTAALSRGADALIVDTAGRLHTQENLMRELEKIRRVLGKRTEAATSASASELTPAADRLFERLEKQLRRAHDKRIFTHRREAMQHSPKRKG